MQENKGKLSKAMLFILLMGIVSMFSDLTHEGATGIRGAYLDLLGASAVTIGFVSGLGELVGYSLRMLFGLFTDKTKKYWPITIIGYTVDLLAVPALALITENGWRWAAALLIVQRMGKAMKKPAKDTILSFAATAEGAGKSFAIQEALDQIGAFLGPVLVYLVMKYKSGSPIDIYRAAFAVLAVPAVVTLFLLLFAKRRFPNPESFEPEPKEYIPFRIKPSFIVYLVAVSMFAFGFIDFSLITMHASKTMLFSDAALPLLYALAMLSDAAAALICGLLYDKKGIKILTHAAAVSAFFAYFIFSIGGQEGIIFGILLWGVGMGAMESVFKAAVSNMIPKKSRATGYGMFEMSFGLFWFLGSWLMGYLYQTNMTYMIYASVSAGLLSAILFWQSGRLQSEEK